MHKNESLDIRIQVKSPVLTNGKLPLTPSPVHLKYSNFKFKNVKEQMRCMYVALIVSGGRGISIKSNQISPTWGMTINLKKLKSEEGC